MASNFSAGQARGQGQAKADEMVESVTGSVQAHHEDASQAAQENKEQAAGFLQQTAEHAKQMAQGAVDSVKSTLGVGDSNNRSS